MLNLRYNKTEIKFLNHGNNRNLENKENHWLDHSRSINGTLSVQCKWEIFKTRTNGTNAFGRLADYYCYR